MSRADSSVLDSLRQPEHTGENRCVPCTVLNLAIAVVVSVLAGRRRRALGLFVLGVSVALIYLRGYLVPGTPALTKRYLPASVRTAFGKHPVEKRKEPETITGTDAVAGTDTAVGASGAENDRRNGDAESGGDAVSSGDREAGEDDEDEDDEPTFETIEKYRREREQSVDAESYLVEAGVVESDGEGGFELTDAFAGDARSRWDEDLTDREALAALFDTDPEGIEELDRDYPAYQVGVRVRKWPTGAAQRVDLATYETLFEYADDWERVPLEQRLDILEWLRGLYDVCPVCGGAVEFSDDVIESCCGQFNVKTIACTDCGERLREFDPTKAGNRQALQGLTP